MYDAEDADPSADLDADPLALLPPLLNAATPVDAGALTFAYHFYLELCCADQRSRDQARKAQQALQRPWSITDQGALRLPGSGAQAVYLVSSSSCLLEGQFTINRKTGKHSPACCKGWIFAGGCYHRAAYEIVRIAQHADLLLTT